MSQVPAGLVVGIEHDGVPAIGVLAVIDADAGCPWLSQEGIEGTPLKRLGIDGPWRSARTKAGADLLSMLATDEVRTHGWLLLQGR
jgi:hypothetical protein